MTLNSGTRLGPYQILAPIGAGGMGEVYRAKDPRLDREVAIKVLPDRAAGRSDAIARFEREAKAVAMLSHPNIMALFDVGTDKGRAYVVMELLKGETLRERLQRSKLSWQKAIEYGVKIAQGLAAAHAQGIIHRDLKPENVFISTDGSVKILDFGLARVAKPGRVENQGDVPTVTLDTKPGTVLGTANYMSPEQIRGRKVDAPSDLFSLGCVLYEMVTGLRAFGGDTSADTMTEILNHDPPTPSASGIHAPPDLERVIARCIEKDAHERFSSARDLAFMLRNIQEGSSPAMSAAAARRSRLRFTALILGGVALAVMLVALVSIVLPRSGRVDQLRKVASLTSFVGREATPSWSPDGGFFAYSHSPSGPMDIFVLSTAGGNPFHLVSSSGDDLSPRWSPDNAYVAFVSGRGPTATANAYLIPPLGGTARKLAEIGIPCVSRLSDAIRSLGAMPWSPDGKSLLFSRLLPSGNLAIFKTELDAAREMQITFPRTGADDLSASWSHDGGWITFCRRDQRGSIWIMKADAAEPQPLISDEFNHYQPVWTRDGQGIVFGSKRSGSANLWQIDVRTRQVRQLTKGPGEDQEYLFSAFGGSRNRFPRWPTLVHAPSPDRSNLFPGVIY